MSNMNKKSKFIFEKKLIKPKTSKLMTRKSSPKMVQKRIAKKSMTFNNPFLLICKPSIVQVANAVPNIEISENSNFLKNIRMPKITSKHLQHS